MWRQIFHDPKQRYFSCPTCYHPEYFQKLSVVTLVLLLYSCFGLSRREIALRHPTLIISSLLLILLLFGSCEKNPDSVVDADYSVGIIRNALLKPAIINTDTVNVGAERKPADTLKLGIIAAAILEKIPPGLEGEAVRYLLWNEDRTKSYGAGDLRDDGIAPDSLRGDRRFTATIKFEIVRSVVGTFNADIWVTSKSGLTSPAFRLPLAIIRLNQPPRLSDLVAPDTLTLGNQNQFLLLQVRASDPDGSPDIKRVSFSSFRPDGSPSSGNPYTMYDDGGTDVIFLPDVRSGDKLKGDGIYSLTIVLPPTTTPGVYRFEFEAVDRSNVPSYKLVHSIFVRP